jgi:hypothetical protein
MAGVFFVYAGYRDETWTPEHRAYAEQPTEVGLPFPTKEEAEAKAAELQAAETGPFDYWSGKDESFPDDLDEIGNQGEDLDHES